MPTLYCYDPQGVFTGTMEAKLDVKETKKQGIPVYLLPARSTRVATPVTELEAPNKYRFVDSAWVVAVDYRGQISYQQVEPYSAAVVTEVGELPVDWALTPPVISE